MVDGDQRYVARLADQIAQARGWPRDWLNDGVRTYLSPQVDGMSEHHVLLRAYPSEQAPGLRVFVPTPEYLLAMKLMAIRIDPAAGTSDLDDMLQLLDVVGLTTPEDTLAFAAAFYPDARVSGRVRLGIQALWHLKDTQIQDSPYGTPRYLGRSRPTP
ncbi:MAG: hypothetical protein FJZ47_13865 [Candidatus Tectomicrobia bacterium]|uniref:Uncharacterized protein n=1 Tax=Tectimicrobiota bacterium TaxID=2528274 RepID=A0A937W3T2_UNCTE|nr:hypothetical protein [Candidatus Tectomicrobia bacterium]